MKRFSWVLIILGAAIVITGIIGAATELLFQDSPGLILWGLPFLFTGILLLLGLKLKMIDTGPEREDSTG